MSRAIEERIIGIVARNALTEALPVLATEDFEDRDMARLWRSFATCGFDVTAVETATGLGELMLDLMANSSFCPTHLPSYVRIAQGKREAKQFRSMTNRLRGGNAIRRV